MEHGSLEKCRIDQDDFGRSMTTATILYREQEGARNAIQNLNKMKILNSVITVELFKWEPRAGGAGLPRTKFIQKQQFRKHDRK
jgi:RNA recognition motif-containing protein